MDGAPQKSAIFRKNQGRPSTGPGRWVVLGFFAEYRGIVRRPPGRDGAGDASQVSVGVRGLLRILRFVREGLSTRPGLPAALSQGGVGE